MRPGTPPGDPPADEADRRLAEDLIAGRPGAFEPFVTRFGPLILSFGRRMCGHRDDADEVLQETLLKAYRSLGGLRDPGALKSWVFRVAANNCLKMRRRGRHEPEREISLEEVLPPRAGGDAAEIADWSELPLDRLLQGELRDRIESAILDLPKPYRVVLLLREQEGFDTRQVAAMLGISETLAKVRLHRARLALRRRLDDPRRRHPEDQPAHHPVQGETVPLGWGDGGAAR